MTRRSISRARELKFNTAARSSSLKAPTTRQYLHHIGMLPVSCEAVEVKGLYFD
jgi:hypothetical protein